MKTKNLFTRLGIASTRSRVLPALIVVLNLIPAGCVTAQTFTTLHSFTAHAQTYYTNSDGANPYAGLVQSGNTLYGTAPGGGSSGNGTVFAVNTDGTGFTTLHSLTAGALGSSLNYTNSDGAYPYADLVLSGNTLYGTAQQGGSTGNGTVFKVNTDGTGFTNLHTFTALSIGPSGTNNDGATPPAGLILSGNTLYGTTAGGGSFGDGTLFGVNTDGTGFTNLHSFSRGSDGAGSLGGLILSGNTLYGTAQLGGSSGNGTVFKANTDGTGFMNLHTFTALSIGPPYPQTNSDGTTPYAGLILSGNTLYGTAYQGGSSGNGTVFKVNTDGSGFTSLHSFMATADPYYTNSDGAGPWGSLILLGNTLYGTANGGGSSGVGTVFAVNTDGSGFTTLYSFTTGAFDSTGNYTNGDGATPQGGLILSGNTLYGTASSGGSSGNGTVFSLSFRPQLTITPSGTNVVLSWPISYAGFSYGGYYLEETAHLGSPDAWVLNDFFPLMIVNDQFRVTGPMRGTQRSFRLKED